jgi:hypothetical protein
MEGVMYQDSNVKTNGNLKVFQMERSYIRQVQFLQQFMLDKMYSGEFYIFSVSKERYSAPYYCR